MKQALNDDPASPCIDKGLTKILVVEDDTVVRLLLVEALRRGGYGVLETGDGLTALQLMGGRPPTLVILDVNLTGMGGFEVVETMRQRGWVQPVIMLSADGSIEHCLKGLAQGADDFIAKPFDVRVLLARVAAILRRGCEFKNPPRKFRVGEIEIDLVLRQAECRGEPMALTGTEFSMLEVLARHSDRAVSKEEMLDAVWGYGITPRTRTVETHIWRLRKKLSHSPTSSWIHNRPGLGYRLTTSSLSPNEAQGRSVRDRSASPVDQLLVSGI